MGKRKGGEQCRGLARFDVIASFFFIAPEHRHRSPLFFLSSYSSAPLPRPLVMLCRLDRAELSFFWAFFCGKTRSLKGGGALGV